MGLRREKNFSAFAFSAEACSFSEDKMKETARVSTAEHSLQFRFFTSAI